MSARTVWHCTHCGEVHDRAEDAACGCGCGDEPMGCGPCMSEGGAPVRFRTDGTRVEPKRSSFWTEGDFDDMEEGGY